MKNKTLIIFVAVLIIGFLGAAQNANNVFAQAQDANTQKTEPAAQSSNQDLLTLIEQLKNQIKDLQDQLTKLTSEVAIVKEEIKITKELYKGVSGDEVKEVQKFLKQFSEIYPEGLVTGYYGPLTEKAVKKFQEREGLSPTGKIDQTTRSTINEYLAGETEKKIIICHYPPENPSNKHSLEISESALETHLAHGDALGACETQPAVASPTPESIPTKSVAVPAESATPTVITTPTPIALPTPTKSPIPITETITPVSASSVIQFVTPGRYEGGYAYGVTTDGSVLCWSTQGVGSLAKPPGSALPLFCSLKDIARIAPGDSHSCAVKTDGFVVCWPGSGKTAEGKTTRAPTLVPLIGR